MPIVKSIHFHEKIGEKGGMLSEEKGKKNLRIHDNFGIDASVLSPLFVIPQPVLNLASAINGILFF